MKLNAIKTNSIKGRDKRITGKSDKNMVKIGR